MIKLKELLVEQKFEYGCVMLYFDFPEMFTLQKLIDTGDLYLEEGDRTFGLEEEPHTTLLFGLHEGVTNEDVENILNRVSFGDCKIYNASKFTNPNYDVFKFDVVGPGLHTANAALKQHPHTSNFPNYHPHCTIAYLQSGKADKYITMLKDKEFKLTPKYAVYSKPSGEKDTLKIKLQTG